MTTMPVPLKTSSMGYWVEAAPDLYRLLAPEETNIDRPLASVTLRQSGLWGWFAMRYEDNKIKSRYSEGEEHTLQAAMLIAERWLSWVP